MILDFQGSPWEVQGQSFIDLGFHFGVLGAPFLDKDRGKCSMENSTMELLVYFLMCSLRIQIKVYAKVFYGAPNLFPFDFNTIQRGIYAKVHL